MPRLPVACPTLPASDLSYCSWTAVWVMGLLICVAVYNTCGMAGCAAVSLHHLLSAECVQLLNLWRRHRLGRTEELRKHSFATSENNDCRAVRLALSVTSVLSVDHCQWLGLRIQLLDHASLQNHNHTLTITCTCCYDDIKGTQDRMIYPHADSLILSLC